MIRRMKSTVTTTKDARPPGGEVQIGAVRLVQSPSGELHAYHPAIKGSAPVNVAELQRWFMRKLRELVV